MPKKTALLCGLLAIVALIGAIPSPPCFAAGEAHSSPEDSGPLLGSLITEPAAMTICALLLVRKFYQLEPSPKLKYATLGLLFVNISVGGTLTNFAANAPNPAGQAILRGYFDRGVSPVGLLKAAVVPTLILFSIFMLFR